MKPFPGSSFPTSKKVIFTSELDARQANCQSSYLHQMEKISFEILSNSDNGSFVEKLKGKILGLRKRIGFNFGQCDRPDHVLIEM